MLQLCFGCALLASACAAQGAAAAQVGTTSFTCSESAAVKSWSDAHCGNTTPTLRFGHVTIAANAVTEWAQGPGTPKPVQKLKATINGIATELTTEGVTGSGTTVNKESGEERWVEGEGSITYAGVTVAKPAGASCEVFTDNAGSKGEKGVIHTEILSATTKAQSDNVKITPKTGNVFATFILAGCKGSEAIEGLNGTYTVNGSVLGQPSGGEILFTHATTTEPETLLINNSIKAGIDGSVTQRGRANTSELFKALTCTTPPYI